jgi:hypothetical protein
MFQNKFNLGFAGKIVGALAVAGAVSLSAVKADIPPFGVSIEGTFAPGNYCSGGQLDVPVYMKWYPTDLSVLTALSVEASGYGQLALHNGFSQNAHIDTKTTLPVTLANLSLPDHTPIKVMIQTEVMSELLPDGSMYPGYHYWSEATIDCSTGEILTREERPGSDLPPMSGDEPIRIIVDSPLDQLPHFELTPAPRPGSDIEMIPGLPTNHLPEIAGESAPIIATPGETDAQ